MKLSRTQLQSPDAPLIGFRDKKIEALGKISLPISFQDGQNARIEYTTFDVVDLYYPYNIILGRGFANKFNLAIHMSYLCMKMPALHGIITVHSSQKEARNIERAIYKSHRNINTVATEEPPDMPASKTDMADQENTVIVPLEEAVPNRKVTIGTNLTETERKDLPELLVKNKDIFAWSTSGLKGISREIIEHNLDLNIT